MAVSTVGNTSSAAAANTDTATKKGLGAAAGMGKDDFMQLLIAQLRNQDPMKPMEDKEFISQLAQFSALEATEKMTAQMEELTSAGLITQAATLLGKQVTAKLTTGEVVSGVVSQVKIVSGKPVAVVNGTELEASLITSIGTTGTAATSAPASGATPAATTPTVTTNAAAANAAAYPATTGGR